MPISRMSPISELSSGCRPRAPRRLPSACSPTPPHEGENLEGLGQAYGGGAALKTVPTVDFLFYPGQDYPGRPWSVWGDGCATDGKYYSAIGDHLAPKGSARIFEYDAAGKKFRLLADVKKVLESSGALPADMNYIPAVAQSGPTRTSDAQKYGLCHFSCCRSQRFASHAAVA